MATRVYSEEEIVLQDDTEITLRPLPVGPLRRFMEAWQRFDQVKDDNDGYDVFINCAGIALEKHFKVGGKFDTLKATPDEQKDGQFLSPEYKTYLEDTLDIETIYKVLEVCGGLKLNDPNLIENLTAAAEAMDGTTSS